MKCTQENFLEILVCLLTLHCERWVTDAVSTSYRQQHDDIEFAEFSVENDASLLVEPPPSPPLQSNRSWTEYAEKISKTRSDILMQHCLKMFDAENRFGRTALACAMREGSSSFLSIVVEAIDECGISFDELQTHSTSLSGFLKYPRPELFLLTHLATRENRFVDVELPLFINQSEMNEINAAWAGALAPTLSDKNRSRIARPMHHPVPANVVGSEETKLLLEHAAEVKEFETNKISLKEGLNQLEVVVERCQYYVREKAIKESQLVD